MAQQNVININPAVLAWARKESGLEMNHVLKALEVDHPTYQLWERFGSNVPFAKLKILAKIFQRQVSIFFLADVPEKTGMPMDNRNIQDFDDKLSPDVSLAVRRANRYCKLLKDLHSEPYYRGIYGWMPELQETFYNPKRIDSEEIAAWVRGRLGVTLDQQLATQSQTQVYRMWRSGVEEGLGIPVFQFKMPLQEIQGFSLNETVPYCIAVNGKHPITGRIFALFHELGHLLKRQSGICFPEKIAHSQILELECNAFASMLLMPREVVRPLDSVEDILAFSNKLKVGGESYLRRLKGLGMVDDARFSELVSGIRDRVKEPVKGFGKATNVEKAINSRGKHLFDTITSAAANNRISFGLASDVLGVKINHLLSY